MQTFQVDSLAVRVYRQQKEMAGDVAQIARDYLQKVVTTQGSAAVILATGNSQIQFLDALIALAGGSPKPIRAVLLGGAAGTFVKPDQLAMPLRRHYIRRPLAYESAARIGIEQQHPRQQRSAEIG